MGSTTHPTLPVQFRPAAAALLLLLALAPGCSTSPIEQQQAQYQIGTPAAFETAAAGGLYQVQYRDRDGTTWRPLPGSERIVSKGDRIGFETTAGGQVAALAAKDRSLLDGLPADAHCCAWSVQLTQPPTPPDPLVDEEKVRKWAVFLVESATYSFVASLARGTPGSPAIKLPW